MGLVITTLGPEVWTKTAVFPMPGWDGQIDHVHLHRVVHFEPAPALSTGELAAEHIHELRWWPLDVLLRSDAVFAPRGLRVLLPELLDGRAGTLPVILEGF